MSSGFLPTDIGKDTLFFQCNARREYYFFKKLDIEFHLYTI